MAPSRVPWEMEQRSGSGGHRRSCGHRGDAGVTSLEYALIASLVAMVIISALLLVSGGVQQLFTTVSTHVSASSS
mgnify:FL=1